MEAMKEVMAVVMVEATVEATVEDTVEAMAVVMVADMEVDLVEVMVVDMEVGLVEVMEDSEDILDLVVVFILAMHPHFIHHTHFMDNTKPLKTSLIVLQHSSAIQDAKKI
jgi:hypothetical protein